MKSLLIGLFLVPSLGFAAGRETASAPSSDDPMANWVPPEVTNASKDKQEIQALIRALESARKDGDLDSAAALVDFPVMMMTNDSRGEGMGEAWDREKWTEMMTPFYGEPLKDAKVTHKRNIFLLSDSLASVDDVYTLTRGGKTITSRTSMFVIRTDGKWRVKAMAEGGWGDTMPEKPQVTAPGAQEPASEGMGSGASEAGAHGTESGAQGGAERTTK